MVSKNKGRPKPKNYNLKNYILNRSQITQFYPKYDKNIYWDIFFFQILYLFCHFYIFEIFIICLFLIVFIFFRWVGAFCCIGRSSVDVLCGYFTCNKCTFVCTSKWAYALSYMLVQKNCQPVRNSFTHSGCRRHQTFVVAQWTAFKWQARTFDLQYTPHKWYVFRSLSHVGKSYPRIANVFVVSASFVISTITDLLAS